MKFSIEAREQMREFLLAVHAASKAHDLPRIVMAVRRSRAVFKPEDYGLNGSCTRRTSTSKWSRASRASTRYGTTRS
jgi:hypothetical protein